MMNKRFLLAISTVYFSMTLQAAPVAPKPVPDTSSVTTAGINHDEKAAEALATTLQSINSLSARFKQQALARQSRINVESGEMLIKRPNQFRWETQEPFTQEIVSRDNKVWVVDPELMQIIIKKQDETLGPTPIQLLSGNAREFLQDYQVVRVGDAGKELVYTLRPRSNSELFEQLDVAFLKGVLASMTLKDTLGGKRLITFTNVVTNKPIDEKRFEVKIPKDFDVIDETGS